MTQKKTKMTKAIEKSGNNEIPIELVSGQFISDYSPEAVNEIRDRHNKISKKETHKLYVQSRPGPGGRSIDFVDEGYMRQVLNENFPVWSWEIIKYEFLGGEAIAVHGRLRIMDNNVSRHFDSLAAHRVSQKQDGSGYSDLGNDMKSANTEAFKVACNRLCNISDDIYRKSILTEEQLDTLEGAIEQIDSKNTKDKVIESVWDNSINPSTFESAMDRINTITQSKKGD